MSKRNYVVVDLKTGDYYFVEARSPRDALIESSFGVPVLVCPGHYVKIYSD